MQEAHTAASSDDVIRIAGRTFANEAETAWTKSGLTVLGGWEADPENASLPGDRDPDVWPTVMQRSAGTFRILSINGADHSVFEDVTFRDGLLGNSGFGGGAHIQSASGVVFRRCRFLDNQVVGTHAKGAGAGVNNAGVLFEACLFRNNQSQAEGATIAYGGAISIEGASSNVELRDCQVVNNVATHQFTTHKAHGGGIRNANGQLTLRNVLMAGNSGKDSGGGILNSSGTLNLF